MKKRVESLTIRGVKYVPRDSAVPAKRDTDGLPFVLVRSRDSGVHAGYLVRRDGTEVELDGSIRIWKWVGAATLSQLSVDGVKEPKSCRFGVPLDGHIVMGCCEVIPCSEKSMLSIQGVESWIV